MERIDGACSYAGPGMVGRWDGDQVAHMAGWTTVGDRTQTDAILHGLTMQRKGASTETIVNQLMPLEFNWLDVPGDHGRVIPAGRA